MALSIVNVAVPGQPFYVPLYGQLGAKGVVGTTPLVFTTVTWAPFLWLVTCVVIIVSYARKPARPHDSHNGPTRESDQDTAASTTSCLPNPVEESSPRGPGPICQITPHRRSPSSHPPRGSVVGNLPTVQPNHNPNQCLQNMARNGLH